MPSVRRASELRSSLVRELDSVSRNTQLDTIGRLSWLRDELENYLDRWLAFAAVESISMKSLLNDDLFAMVQVASDVFEQQLSVNGATLEEWHRFRLALSRVENAKNRSVIIGLRADLDAVGTALRELK